MRTARCVASHTVPRRSTTPRIISAAMARALCNGDLIEVTRNVASTSVNMAASVIARINTVVTMDASTVFIVRGEGKAPLAARIAQAGANQNGLKEWRGGMGISTQRAQRTRREREDPPSNPRVGHPSCSEGSAEAGPVVGDEDGVGGIGGVVLDAGRLAGD